MEEKASWLVSEDEVHRPDRGEGSQRREVLLVGYGCKACAREWIKITVRRHNGNIKADISCPYCGSEDVVHLSVR